MSDLQRIRNFCIIAHIDHGKSTLADRLLEITGTIPARQMAEQVLDQMDLERERGITIKATAVRMDYQPAKEAGARSEGKGGSEPLAPGSFLPVPYEGYELNLIDTPGHVDFTYEVSRALAACEGALLVVDASQGIEAQTLANVYMALEQDLAIIPVVNKIDLASAEPERVAQELVDVVGFSREEVLFVSAKEGTGCEELLRAIVERVPAPTGEMGASLRALIFDSKYDSYKGVVAYVRVVDGELSARRKLRLMANGRSLDPIEAGVFRPSFAPTDGLSTGEVGYVATGLKTVRECRVGDTITDDARPAVQALAGYSPAKPMVFAGLYPANAEDFELLRDALEKLQLNDASLQYQPEQSVALGPGFRAGFLGLLHMDIVQERLEREYDLDLLATAPSVEYRVLLTGGAEVAVDSPAELPDPSRIAEVREPWMTVSIVSPDRYYGAIMELVTGRRGAFVKMEYLERGVGAKSQEPGARSQEGAGSKEPGQGDRRVLMDFKVPLSEMLVDFYDQLKSRTQGYASMDYAVSHYAGERLVKVDVLVNGVPVDALSVLIDADKAASHGRALVEKLRSLIPRQLFEVPIQAAVGGRIVARESVRALRKNVLAKCYGGDVTRKRKLLEKQKAGKKRMKRVGNVDIPQEAFMSLLRIGK
ncbi:MAG TPA: translation elongation factor 4 [Dehalococcoidia bacterium]|nr:translation elongation factor 4 [Dehalococcoidia bacterium]